MRSMLSDPEQKASKIVFGSKATAVNLSALARETGIPVSCMSYYRKAPQKMNLGRFAAIVKKRGLTDDEIIKAVRILGEIKQ